MANPPARPPGIRNPRRIYSQSGRRPSSWSELSTASSVGETSSSSEVKSSTSARSVEMVSAESDGLSEDSGTYASPSKDQAPVCGDASAFASLDVLFPADCETCQIYRLPTQSTNSTNSSRCTSFYRGKTCRYFFDKIIVFSRIRLEK